MRVAIGLALCVLAFPAFAKEKPKPTPCKLNYTAELRDAREAAQSAPIGVYPIDGGDVAKFLAIFNAAEPKTDFKADRILVLASPAFAYVEMFEGGCVNHSGRLAPPDFEALMMRAYGDNPAPGAMRM